MRWSQMGVLGGPSGAEVGGTTLPLREGLGGGRRKVEVGRERRDSQTEKGRSPASGSLANSLSLLQTPRCGPRSTCGSGWSGR